MKVNTVDHIEFYVEDADRTAEFLSTGFGFRCRGRGGPATGLAGQRSLLLENGGVRLLVTSGLAGDHPATRYVERHGDGVAALAIRVDDARRAFTEAVRAGATAVSEPRDWGGGAVVAGTVSGPGSLTHTLIERRPDNQDFLPGAIDPVEFEPDPAPDPGPGPDLLGVVDHLALCVAAGELDPAVDFYRDVFGFTQIFEERVEVGDQAMDSKVVQSPSREVTLTIVSPDPATRSGQLDDFLRAHAAAGVQHLAFSTSDILTAVRVCGAAGVRFLTTPDTYYDGIERRLGDVGRSVAALREANILVDRDHWGEMFQIFTESPFPRRTCFFELIERHGALTFGSNNIKALYEATERARAGAHAQS